MEASEIKHINDNKTELIRLTKCGPLLFAGLTQEGVLDDPEVAKIKGSGTVFEQAEALYDLLMTKDNCYSTILKVFESTKQSGALKILENKPIMSKTELGGNLSGVHNTVMTQKGSSTPTQPEENLLNAEDQTATKVSASGIEPFKSKYLEEYEPDGYLGKGSFGIVFKAKKKFVDGVVAVKVIELTGEPSHTEIAKREAKALANLSHQNIVRYFDAWIEAPPPGWMERHCSLWKKSMKTHDATDGLKTNYGTSYLYITQEVCSEGTLKDWLGSNAIRKAEAIVRIMSKIAKGVNYIHEQKYIHRDLKPSNIFLDQVSGKVNVKIGDFGLVRLVFAEKGGSSSRNLAARGEMSSPVGTLLYMAPEIVDAPSYDYRVDIYSLGKIFCELLFHCKTDEEIEAHVKKLRQTEFPEALVTQLSGAGKLIQSMINNDPNQRPGLDTILSCVNDFKRTQSNSTANAVLNNMEPGNYQPQPSKQPVLQAGHLQTGTTTRVAKDITVAEDNFIERIEDAFKNVKPMTPLYTNILPLARRLKINYADYMKVKSETDKGNFENVINIVLSAWSTNSKATLHDLICALRKETLHRIADNLLTEFDVQE